MAPIPIFAGSRITAAMLNACFPVGAIKPGDQDVTSSTTLVGDTDLIAQVAGGATYLFYAFIEYTGGTHGSSDIQWKWGLPAGATLRYEVDYQDTTLTPQAGRTSLGNVVVVAGTNNSALMGAKMQGTLIMSTASGSIQLQWAQNTSSATPTVVKAQSYVALQRMT